MLVDRNNCKVIPKDILFGYNGNALQVKANTSVAGIDQLRVIIVGEDQQNPSPTAALLS